MLAEYRTLHRWMIAVSLIGLVALGVPARAGSCPDTGDQRVEIAAVDRRLELRLVDGRLIRLAGFDPVGQTPADPDLEDRSRAALAAMIAGRSLSMHVVTATPDRWGRTVALVFASAASDAQQDDLATHAISIGLGRYLAEPAAHACRDALIAAETVARTAKLGLWGDPYYAVMAVDDAPAFTERSGTIVVAEGRLAGVVPGPFRTKLNFTPIEQGSHGGHALSATILPRTMKTFEARRLIPVSLTGRVLRLRGLLDLRFGPQIELEDPDQIEIVDPVPETASTGRPRE